MNIIQQIKTSKLKANTGQISGLPTNPRQWSKEDVERIAKSLQETPELFQMRPCIVYPVGDTYIVLGGNLRLAGAKHNKEKEVPCIVIPADTPVEKMKEIVIKDNGSFGEWDMDALANEWDDLPLAEWGVDIRYSDNVDLTSMFDEDGENNANSKEVSISVKVPICFEDNIEDIKASLRLTLDQWKGCEVK